MDRLLLVTAAAVFVAAATHAADLGQLRAPGPKVPPQIAKSAKYCLLVFGPEAKTRVWLAWDGTAIYADPTGAGDLTRPEARIAGKKWNEKDTEEDGWRVFNLGDVPDDGRTHKEVSISIGPLGKSTYIAGAQEILARDPKARCFQISAYTEVPGQRGVRSDGRLLQRAGPYDTAGVLQFSGRPEEAPVLHLGGPWTLTLQETKPLRVNRAIEVYLSLSTVGLGKGTEVWTGYDSVVPADVFPGMEVAFAPQTPGAAKVKVAYELKGRC